MGDDGGDSDNDADGADIGVIGHRGGRRPFSGAAPTAPAPRPRPLVQVFGADVSGGHIPNQRHGRPTDIQPTSPASNRRPTDVSGADVTFGAHATSCAETTFGAGAASGVVGLSPTFGADVSGADAASGVVGLSPTFSAGADAFPQVELPSWMVLLPQRRR